MLAIEKYLSLYKNIGEATLVKEPPHELCLKR